MAHKRRSMLIDPLVDNNPITLQVLDVCSALARAGFAEVDPTFLGLISYIGVIAALVQILEMVLDKYFRRSATRWGSFCR